MTTPICDFVQRYAQSAPLRLHMPGHKGHTVLGAEPLDVTEIPGADSLYEASGIIEESEQNAGTLFGCKTLYSTEGSSQCIRAMLYLAMLHGKSTGRTPLIAAARNVHKTFLSAAALLDLDVMWVYPQTRSSYLSCSISPQQLEDMLRSANPKPTALYVTSPDYLGNMADIAGLSRVCHRHQMLLLVDNAHGAYLRFLSPSQHPMDLGADLCCDSAHKTLPVLTGGAYLHIAPRLEKRLGSGAKNAMALFGSTSPSYLILQSLDAANLYLKQLPELLRDYLPLVQKLRSDLEAGGYVFVGQEPVKLTISAKAYGYTGTALSEHLAAQNMICEFSDPDYLVLMLNPEIGADALQKLKDVLLHIPKLSPIHTAPPEFRSGVRVCSPRDAMFSLSCELPVESSAGYVLSSPSVGCPPAVPILICGERIDAHAIDCFRYYGIRQVSVMADSMD